tara:strand:+ start:465 stop:662 length:198 start_codon:yes stop_codon:yes gene_type:complete
MSEDHENYQDYRRMMADEAKQAAKDNAANPTKDIPRVWTTEIAGGREHYDPVSGVTYFESDYDGE